MLIEHSKHWLKKRKYRSDITDETILYCIQNSNRLKDKYWKMLGMPLIEFLLPVEYLK